MIEDELVEEVLTRLPPYWRTRMGAGKKKLVRMILRIVYDVIIEATSLGEDIRIRNFCIIERKEFVKCRKDRIDRLGINLKPSIRWRRVLHRTAGIPWKSTGSKKEDKT